MVLAGSAALLARPAMVTAQAPILPPDGSLRPGQFAWRPELSPRRPVMVLVSLTEQLARVYRNGIEIGVSTASSGRPGHATPTGVFTILQKARVHHSSTYNEASMPYTERLTWDGVALHAGGVPGYPSSHGCVHLPLEFARLLFGVTEVGTTVLVADAHGGPQEVAHAGLILPTAELTAAAAGDYVWQPARSPSGPVSLLLSVADRRLHVYRNGEEIGTAAASFARPEEPIVPAVFVRLDREPPAWSQVALSDAKVPPARSDVLDRLVLPPPFAAAVLPELAPGTSLYATLASAGEETRTGPGFTVIANREA
jgi:L,D-transpeptidase catalytic domain